MKTIICVCFLALAAIALARPEEKYTDKYDNINIDEILENHRLLTPYFKCIIGDAKCAPEAKELKEHIQEALENECAKCNDKQKEATKKVIAHLINHEQEFWQRLVAKYDPEQKFNKKYEKELKTIKA